MSTFHSSHLEEKVVKEIPERSVSIDLFDEVIDLEAEAYKEGVSEGVAAARDGLSFKEGEKAGYLRGFALGLEFGFMETVTESSIEKNHDVPSRRTIKRQSDILARMKAIPLQNVDTIDFDEELRELRGLYKQCGLSVGAFLRPKGQQPLVESSLW